MQGHDPVNHPSHYTSLGARCSFCGTAIECIDITKHLSFTIGNAVKYLWRNGRKGDEAQALEDLRKARWYVDREIERREQELMSETVRAAFTADGRDPQYCY